MLARRKFMLSATAGLALPLAAPAIAQSDKPIPVVATFSILGDMVKRIGGEHISVTTLVGPQTEIRMFTGRPLPMLDPSVRRRFLSSTGYSSRVGWTG